MQINAVYATFDGETNKFGIGYPTIFVRTQGCHIRCYSATLGHLCDTPEALQKSDQKGTPTEEIMQTLRALSRKTGITKVTLSGGDPLWRKPEELHEFFQGLYKEDFDCTVETSGTLSIEEYARYSRVWWVLDYKLPSCGLDNKHVQQTTARNFRFLKEGDFVKFVVYDSTDFIKACEIVTNHPLVTGRYAMGPYWGGPMSGLELFKNMEKAGLLHSVSLNMQTHKLLLNPDYTADVPKLL